MESINPNNTPETASVSSESMPEASSVGSDAPPKGNSPLVVLSAVAVSVIMIFVLYIVATGGGSSRQAVAPNPETTEVSEDPLVEAVMADEVSDNVPVVEDTMDDISDESVVTPVDESDESSNTSSTPATPMTSGAGSASDILSEAVALESLLNAEEINDSTLQDAYSETPGSEDITEQSYNI
jgi:hypothetical protein